MAGYDPLDPDRDPFRPPAVPTLVACLHCGQEYDSYRIEWRVEEAEGRAHGFWCCPVPGCGGRGFGCDILPVDPGYRDERGGWVYDDEEEMDESGEDGQPPGDTRGHSSGDGDEALPW